MIIIPTLIEQLNSWDWENLPRQLPDSESSVPHTLSSQQPNDISSLELFIIQKYKNSETPSSSQLNTQSSNNASTWGNLLNTIRKI